MRSISAAICLAILLPTLAAGSQECAWSPLPSPSPAIRWRELAVRADALAASPAGGRRRSVRVVEPRQVPANFIDVAAFARMTEDGVRWAPRSTDQEFLRRVSLDLTGQIPTAARARDFLGDADPDKRQKLVDELLASEEFVDRWSLWLGDVVQNVISANMSYVGPEARNAFYEYLRDAVRQNEPYDAIVREIIDTSGIQSRVRAYVLRRWIISIPQDSYDNLAAASGEQFLGLPLNCISCHGGRGHLESVNRSLAERTRLDFWKMAAFFSRTQVILNVVGERTTGNYVLGTTSGNKTPRLHEQRSVDPEFLTGGKPADGESWRAAYARLVIADPRFASIAVNRIWKEMFGLAFVEPVGNVDLDREDATPHRALLDALAASFRSSGYDLRALLRAIALSETYQFSRSFPAGGWSAAWTPYFARHLPRRMLAESTVDAIFRSTGVGGALSVRLAPPAASAMRLPDTTEGAPLGGLLDDFGRGNRDDELRTEEMAIPQLLRLLNDREVISRAASPEGLAQRLVRAGKTAEEIVEEIYLATLTRRPTADELRVLSAELAREPRVDRAIDLQLALFQSAEFLFY